MRSPFSLLAALVLALSLAACAPAAPQPAASDPPGPEQSAASEEARPLTLDELLAMAEEDRFGQADFSSYSNAMVAGQGVSNARTSHITFSFSHEGDAFTLDAYIQKEDDQLSELYLTRESNHDVTRLYPAETQSQSGADTGIREFLSHAYDIRDDISYQVPDGLEEQPYHADSGLMGARLLGPDAYSLLTDPGSASAPQAWYASGMVSRFPVEDVLEWEDGQITQVRLMSNHTVLEDLGPLDGLCAPAFLTKATHDLYTHSELMELEQAGVDLDTLDTASEYWDVYLARPGDTVGYLFRLNAKHYTQQDAVDFAKTMAYLD